MDARAEEIIAYYQGEIDFVQSRVSTLSPSEQQTVYLANWANHLGTTWTTCKYWPIESAGGINVAEGMTPTYGEVTEEQILEWNPDVIFIHGMKGKSAAEDITSSALLQGTDAVKNGRVYGLFGPYIGSDPKLWLADMYITAKALYPDLFSDISITAKGEEIFVFCYGAGMGPLFERSITDRGAYISPELTP
jgi:iron complex transport system substrate-binding protein